MQFRAFHSTISPSLLFLFNDAVSNEIAYVGDRIINEYEAGGRMRIGRGYRSI
jgi:hypothetical protein